MKDVIKIIVYAVHGPLAETFEFTAKKQSLLTLGIINLVQRAYDTVVERLKGTDPSYHIEVHHTEMEYDVYYMYREFMGKKYYPVIKYTHRVGEDA